VALLEIQNLNRRFGGLQAVNNVSFNVEKGMIKAVIGPNGAGKTTLFNLIAGNLPVNSGKINFNKAQITGRKPYQIAQQGISRTYQNIKLFHGMTALENVMHAEFALDLARGKKHQGKGHGVP
jgi:branched-chain amino acid transport system ATP-binding protein